MKRTRRDRGVTTVEWVIVAMVIGVGMIAVFRTFKDSYLAPATNRMGDCIEAAAGDGNLCGGLATGGASSGGGGNAGGALAQNGGGNGTGGNGATPPGSGGNAATAPGAGGGMSANELANSVGENHAANPHAGVINGISNGMGLAQAGEDALIDATKKASGIEVPGLLDKLFRGARVAEGAIIGVPLDLIAQGIPHSFSDAASFTVKNGVIGLVGFFGTPLAAAGLVGLDKSLGYLSDSITGGTRYQEDWKDSWAYQLAHTPPGTIGKEGLEAEQANEQRMLHEQIDYMHQQQARDAEALREMMPH
ncbi:MAG TPA: hypothetical protein VGL86_05160 [Polyangia bacterium]|jgi:Flp pilus assembly pilin Flp